MKILSKKEVEALFDDIMTLNLIVCEAIRQQIMDEHPDIKTLLRTNRIVTERCANATYTLRGLFGIKLAYEIQKQYDERRLAELVDEEAKNDNLDEECEQ